MGRLQRVATTRVESVMEPDPTDTMNSVSGLRARNTSPTARSSGSMDPSRRMTQAVTSMPSARSSSQARWPATAQVMLSATSTQWVPMFRRRT